jgi:phosphatidylglycerophosphate synthase
VPEPAPLPVADQPPLRPAELEDWLNRRLYHPLSWRLARRLARTAITPDMVSVAGALAIMLAALAYSLPGWPWVVVLGLALHMAWHVLDGADGDLARLTGRASPRGELIDGICDYAGHIVLYVVLGSIAATALGNWGWALMWMAGASRVAQAAHYEGVRRQYQLVVYGTPWLASAARTGGGLGGRKHPFVAYYLWLTSLIIPHGRAMTDAAQSPGGHDALRGAMLAQGPHVLGRMSVLSANYRTLAVGAAMLASAPQWYFLFEVVLLNFVLLVSLRRVRAVFGAALAQAGVASTRR